MEDDAQRETRVMRSNQIELERFTWFDMILQNEPFLYFSRITQDAHELHWTFGEILFYSISNYIEYVQ